jgi:hypothetical protein
MSKLTTAFQLPRKVSVYVPATMQTDKPIDNAAQVERVASTLAGWFGGATSVQCIGYWVAQDGTLIKEGTTQVYAYCTAQALTENLDRLYELCETLKADMQQESVALEVDNKLYLI